MKYYFQLQVKMLNRHFIDFGIEPLIAYVLLAICFIFGSHVLFEKFEFALYAYPFIGLALLSKLSSKDRNDFLKLSFLSKEYKRIRVIENLILVSPFVFFLFYKKAFIIAILLYVLALLVSFLKLQVSTNITIPTLFKKDPFEFTEGFRKTLLVFPVALLLTITAIKVHNLNLGAFSIIIIFGTCISYFSKTENPYYVWMFNKSPKEFLHYKIETAFKYASLVSLPITVVLSVFFTSEIIILIAIQLIGYVYLAQYILAKYSVFPTQMSLPTVIIFMLSISLPPFVFFTFPYFYIEAVKKLNPFLDD